MAKKTVATITIVGGTTFSYTLSDSVPDAVSDTYKLNTLAVSGFYDTATKTYYPGTQITKMVYSEVQL